jgi:hypothetical protein
LLTISFDNAIDDSLSMITEESGRRLGCLQRCVQQFSDIYALARPMGIVSINMLNDPDSYANVRPSEIMDLLHKHTYAGLTRIRTQLKAKILDPLVNNKAEKTEKPLLIITITDGDVSSLQSSS